MKDESTHPQNEPEPTRRLLEVALGEVTGGRTAPDVTAAVRRRLAAAPKAKVPLLQAALLLLGLGVVVAVWWWRERGDASALQQPGQESQSWPLPSISCTGVHELQQLPDDLHGVQLLAELSAPAELAELQRFGELTQLCVSLPSKVGNTRVEIGADELAPLAAMPQLQQLNLLMGSLTPAALAPLAKATRLQVLGLWQVPLDRDLAAALATLPQLRELRLGDAAVTAAGADGLTQLPRLDTLWLGPCDAAGQARLGTLPGLRVLRISGAGMPAGVLGGTLPELVPALWQSLAKAPHAELHLHRCRVDDALLATLPANLEALSLLDCEGVTPAALRGMKRCGQLRSLALGRSVADQREADRLAAAEAELIGALRLCRFEYQGELGAVMARAIAAQTGLCELHLRKPAAGPADLSFVSGLASLQRVVLYGSWGAEVRPLADCRRLRRVELCSVVGQERPDENAPKLVRAALGPGIEVIVW